MHHARQEPHRHDRTRVSRRRAVHAQRGRRSSALAFRAHRRRRRAAPRVLRERRLGAQEPRLARRPSHAAPVVPRPRAAARRPAPALRALRLAADAHACGAAGRHRVPPDAPNVLQGLRPRNRPVHPSLRQRHRRGSHAAPGRRLHPARGEAPEQGALDGQARRPGVQAAAEDAPDGRSVPQVDCQGRPLRPPECLLQTCALRASVPTVAVP
mmetsp:Transcript_46250/g.142653  ORF Transcript_46250/g.142653 Transcript_46250/m.142653 type:complete len:212 (+) Transcript_46250:634-1269(+)